MVRPPLSASNSTHPSMNPPTLPDPNRPPPPPSQLNIQHPSIPPDLSKFVEEPEENLEENQIQERSRELHQAGDKLAQISIKEGKDAEWKKQGSLKEQDKQGAERDRSFRSPADQHPSEEGVDLSAIMKSLQIAIPEDIEVGYQGEEIQKPEENSHFRLLMKVASSSGMPRNIPLKALNDAMSSAWGGKYWIIDQVQSAMYIAYFRSEDAMDFVLKRQPWSVDSDNLLLEWINPKEAEKNFEDYQFRSKSKEKKIQEATVKQVMDESRGGKPRWVRTKVDLDDHIIVPRIDPAAVECDPDKAVEDYVASLSMLPMDRRRPLWEFHLLDFPTSEATSTMVLRLHHSIGDGMSLMTLYVASSRSTADPARLPTMPPPPRRTGEIYQLQPRPPLSSGKALLAWVLSYLVLAWHTLVDCVLLAATILFLSDPRTMFVRSDGGLQAQHRKRFIHRNLSLDDVKLIKTAVKCALTVHYQNYGNTINVTLAVDDKQFPDCHELLDDLVESIRLIKNAAGLRSISSVHSN
ncbi:hypothetical protein ACQ4PT_010683 [Festuca glaucescens]